MSRSMVDQHLYDAMVYGTTANTVNIVKPQGLLCIGGPLDRTRHDGRGAHMFYCTEMPRFRASDLGSNSRNVSVSTHVYHLMTVGNQVVYVHQSLNHNQALDRMLDRYEKKPRAPRGALTPRKMQRMLRKMRGWKIIDEVSGVDYSLWKTAPKAPE